MEFTLPTTGTAPARPASWSIFVSGKVLPSVDSCRLGLYSCYMAKQPRRIAYYKVPSNDVICILSGQRLSSIMEWLHTYADGYAGHGITDLPAFRRSLLLQASACDVDLLRVPNFGGNNWRECAQLYMGPTMSSPMTREYNQGQSSIKYSPESIAQAKQDLAGYTFTAEEIEDRRKGRLRFTLLPEEKES